MDGLYDSVQPLLFAGDFNVDNHTFAAEVAELTELLGAHSPVPIGDQHFTSEYVRVTASSVSVCGSH